MNSFAHYSFGAVYQWMVDYLGGILRAAPGYKEMLIAPQLDERLSYANVSYRSIHGLIATAWKWQGNKLLFDVTVPANTTAVVAIPAHAAADITEGGHQLAKAEGVKFLRMDGSNALLSVGSGKYAFAVTQR
jgi:alpha-L-rhamnosidase